MGVKTSSLYCVLVLSIICSYEPVKAESSLDDMKKALDIIADFADRTCSKIPLEGSGNSVELTGEGKTELKGMLKKVANLGIEGAAKYEETEWTNVLQKDLAKKLQESDTCRMKVFNELKDRIIPKKEDSSAPHSATIENTGNGTAIIGAENITINNK